MTLLLRFMANGDLAAVTVLTGLALTVIDAVGLLDRRPRTARMAAFALLLAGALAALGAPPIPLEIAVPLVAAFCVHVLLGFHHRRPLLRRGSAILLTLAATVAIVHEAPYVVGPPRPGTTPRSLVVLADSLTAGGYGEARTWPRILALEDGLAVEDLSRDGQTVQRALDSFGSTLEALPLRPSLARESDDARPTRESRPARPAPWDPRLATIDDAPSIEPSRRWVLIELGGNDVLGESTLAAYTESLDRLLALSRGDEKEPRTVVMLEIPAVPGRWGFAAAQRRLAARHGVVLVPRRVLANIVFAPGSTSDDALHLTQRGHERFAVAVRPWLGLAR